MWPILLLFLTIVTTLLFLYYISPAGNNRTRKLSQQRHKLPPPFSTEPHQCQSSNCQLNIHPADIHTTICGCKALLSGTWRSEEYAQDGGEHMLTLLENRAGPSRRLAEAFGIDFLLLSIRGGIGSLRRGWLVCLRRAVVTRSGGFCRGRRREMHGSLSKGKNNGRGKIFPFLFRSCKAVVSEVVMMSFLSG